MDLDLKDGKNWGACDEEEIQLTLFRETERGDAVSIKRKAVGSVCIPSDFKSTTYPFLAVSSSVKTE